MSTINEKVSEFIKKGGFKSPSGGNYWDFWMVFISKYPEDSPKSDTRTVSGIVFKSVYQSQHASALYAKFEGETDDKFVHLGSSC